MEYVISYDESDYSNSTFIVYDIPTYFQLDRSKDLSRLKVLKTKQYPGYLIDINNFKDLNDYLSSNFSKSSRNKLRKYKRRLETCFDISYKMHRGAMSFSDYQALFIRFRQLLEKRFDNKQTTNNNLNKKEWDFYQDVAYDLISENRAALFVIYDNDIPIGITLCYFSDDILFDAITVFDTDYSKFHLGSVTIMKLIEWCIDNELKILDFSKGYFEYKTHWCTRTYDFEYHLLYDSKSFFASSLAYLVKLFFDAKQYLRQKRINEYLHKLTFLLKSSQKKILKKPNFHYEISEFTASQNNNFTEIDLSCSSNHTIKLLAYDYAYLNEVSFKDITILKDKKGSYLIQSTRGLTKAIINYG